MKPLWRQMFDAVEQAAGPAMADATASKAFADFAKVSSKMSKDMTRQLESASRQWLHLWNLPAAGDVTALKRQIGSLEAQLRAMQREAQEQHLVALEQAAVTAQKLDAKKPEFKKSQVKEAEVKKAETKKAEGKKVRSNGTKQAAKKARSNGTKQAAKKNGVNS